MDCLTPIEENWDGWRLDMETSTSDVLYAFVEHHQYMTAVELGWLPISAPVDGERMMLLVKGYPGNQYLGTFHVGTGLPSVL